MNPANNSEPDPLELQILGVTGRLKRLMQEEGLSFEEAAGRLFKPETAAEYVARNSAAMERIEARMLSAEYMEKFLEAQNHPDPARRVQMMADLKRENFATLDIEALHRTISARNRQLQAEGLLPPDSPI